MSENEKTNDNLLKNEKTVSTDSVGSVEEYIARISEIYNDIKKRDLENGYKKYYTKLWFRGLKSSEYALEPTIARGSLNAYYEILFLSKFKSKAIPYVDQIPSYWGWLFLMQHYGIATRLMDWTKDALIALVFAVGRRSDKEKLNDSAVWCLDPVKLNEAFSFYEFYERGYIPNIEEDVVNDIFGPSVKIRNKKPCAVIGPMNNARIVAQKGVFTIFPLDKQIIPLNKFKDNSNYLYKIYIDKDKCDYIADQLKGLGITITSLYPEITSIKLEIDEEGY